MAKADRSIQKGQWQSDYSVLRNHLVEVVRKESRAAQLLYAFMRGVPRSDLEPKRIKERDGCEISSRVLEKAKRNYYGTDREKLRDWLNEAC